MEIINYIHNVFEPYLLSQFCCSCASLYLKNGLFYSQKSIYDFYIIYLYYFMLYLPSIMCQWPCVLIFEKNYLFSLILTIFLKKRDTFSQMLSLLHTTWFRSNICASLLNEWKPMAKIGRNIIPKLLIWFEIWWKKIV